MINFQLAKEIYGMNPWCVDQASLPALLAILDNLKIGVSLEAPSQKYNSICLYDPISKEIRVIDRPFGNDWSRGQLENKDDFYGVAIINLDGVITVSGGASSYGVDHITEQMFLMAKDRRIISFIVLGNSGGGSSMAVEVMADAIKEIDKTKPVYGLVKKGGMMASACFGIMSACRGLWAESEMSTVGSAGTMVQFEGRVANNGEEDQFKYKHIRLYAPESDHKNKDFEDAIQKNDYTLLIDELLKPVNDRFLNLIETNRPQLKGTSFRNGHTVFAKDGVGTFIDGIKSFGEVLEIASVVTESDIEGITIANNSNTNINNKQMTKAEFKTAHPTAYTEIVAEGIAQEKDRVGAWMAHVETDAEAVKNGIESGKEISQSQRETFFVKQNSKNAVKTIKTESAEDIATQESVTDVEKIKNEAKGKETDSAFKFDLN